MDSIAKKIIDYFLYSNFWIAIGVVLLCAESFVFLPGEISFSFLFFAGCSTLFIYNLQRFFLKESDISPVKYEQYKWIVSHRKIVLITCFLSGTAVLIFASGFTFEQLFFLSPVAVTTLFYSVGDNKKIKGIREIPYLKIFVFSFSWGYVTGFLPGIFSGNSFSEFYPVFIMKTLFAFCVYIPFEIRDMDEDPGDLRTFPQVFGVKGSLIAGLLMMVLFTWFSLAFSAIPSVAVISVVFITVIALLFSAAKKKEMFYLLIVDSLLVVKPLFSFAALKFL